LRVKRGVRVDKKDGDFAFIKVLAGAFASGIGRRNQIQIIITDLEEPAEEI
jgi:hypothetical protein